MPYLCTFRESGSTYVATDSPVDVTHFEHVTFFETWGDADTAAMLLNRVKQAARVANVVSQDDKVKELTEKLGKQAEIIRNQQVSISSLKVSVEGARNIIERAFNTIAQDLVVLGTHRERNAIYRIVARSLHQWLQYPHESGNMDDIPF